MVHEHYHLFSDLSPTHKGTYLLLKTSNFVHFSLLNLSLVNLFHYFCPLDLKITNTKIIKFMSLKIVVLAKQVPDTRNVGKDAMNADGTINRAALPALVR